ncbi:MAG: selenocysteine-specific translation elongation factor [Acidobacteriota bacterium]
MNLIIGTAGHIDHGKTALVRALTGIDADRLPEEKQRGITIDLGFAELRLGDLEIGFVDVPGHERFVRNMLAGAGGIDVVLMVVAADEGVMPQTREHFEICRLLGTKAGIVVLTKRDLVDDEMLELVKLDVAELTEHSFLENAPVIAVSSKSGEGIGELKDAIRNISSQIPKRTDLFVARLPVDRSFTMKGFGSVVTGTLLAGEITEGSELELLPAGSRVRVRGVQTQGRSVKAAAAGQRTALNLGGIDHSDVERGMVLAEAGVIEPTQIIDTRLEVVPGAARPVRSRQRVRFHIGAAEVLGRVHVLNETGELEPGAKEHVQFRLEHPVIALPGDTFIIRSYSPQATIAGGIVLNALAQRHRKRDLAATNSFLKRLFEAGQDAAELCRLFVDAAGAHGLGVEKLRAKTGFAARVAADAINGLAESGRIVPVGGHLIAAAEFAELKRKTLDLIKAAQTSDPLAGGVSRETVRDRVFAFIEPSIFNKVIADLQTSGAVVAENDVLKLAGQTSQLSERQIQVLENFREIFRPDNLEVPKLDEVINNASAKFGIGAAESRKIFQTLINSNEVLKINSDFYFAREAVDDLIAKLRKHAETAPDRLIDVPSFKELAGISRKYAIPILEYFDSSRITIRQGDKRRVI